MKYEQVYGAMDKLNEIKKDLGLEGIATTEEEQFAKYTTELEMIIDKSIDILQFQLRTRASELQMEGLTSNKINPTSVMNNLLKGIDESFTEE